MLAGRVQEQGGGVGCLICTEISLRAAYLAMRTLLREVGMHHKLFWYA
jgi:hypothetical protein